MKVLVSLLTVVVQAAVFWLAGAMFYFAIGHHAQFAMISIRVTLAVAYVATALWVPQLSHVMVSIELLGTGDFRIGEVAGLSG